MKNRKSSLGISYEQLQRAAYLNYLDRTRKGLPGNESEDWEKARIHLELKIKRAESTGKPAEASPKPTRSAEPKTPKSGADNLRLLAGLGPKIESRLREAGVTSLKQIASWKAQDVEAISKELKLGNRIAREKWVEQAKALIKK